MVESENDLEHAHADKYNDPRVQITRRGILMGVGVLILGIIGAAGSIYARKTRLEKSREFWGDETILALQLAERIQMVALCGKDFGTVELTATPGLGHLRHALLDERSYQWDSSSTDSVMEMCANESDQCVQLRLTDPTAHRFEIVEINLDLKDGWVGPSDGSRRVRTTKRVRPALGKFLDTMITVQQKSYDNRL